METIHKQTILKKTASCGIHWRAKLEGLQTLIKWKARYVSQSKLVEEGIDQEPKFDYVYYSSSKEDRL